MKNLENTASIDCVLRDGTRHSRVIMGAWQLSEGHSASRQGLETLRAYVRHGVSAIDCADIYTGVEEAIGAAFPADRPDLGTPRVHTKHVPDLSEILSRSVTVAETRARVERSLSRVGRDSLDLVQFHQWDYAIDTYRTSVETLLAMQAEGKIASLGVTNSSVDFLRTLERECGFVPVSTQNQYSVIDRRPERLLLPYARERDMGLYAYGTVMGGLLSERYLDAPEPVEPLENRSLRKYLRVIHDWGDWALFQRMLAVLADIARERSVGIAEIATAHVLGQDGVSAAIVGARHPDYAPMATRIAGIRLTEEERARIDEVYALGRPLQGDCFDLERYDPRHRDIMKFDLGKEKS